MTHPPPLSFPCTRHTFAAGRIEPRRISEARDHLKRRVRETRHMTAEFPGHVYEIEHQMAVQALERFNDAYPEPVR